jgi:hypothetical protein
MRIFWTIGAIVGISVSLRPVERHVLQPPVQFGQLRFEARSEAIAGGSVLRTTVRIVNRGRDSTWIELGADCTVVTRVYKGDVMRKEPVWDGLGRICFSMSRAFKLLPNRPIEVSRADTIARILGDSLAAGTYDLSAVLRVQRAQLEIPTGSMFLRR